MTDFTAVRAHVYSSGAVILAANHNANENEIYQEHNNAIHATTGHTHSGSTGDGPKLNSTGLDLTATYPWTGTHSWVTANTTGTALALTCDSVTTGKALSISSNSSSSSARTLVSLVNDHASATGTTVLKIQQDSTGDAITTVGGGVSFQTLSNFNIYSDAGTTLTFSVHGSSGNVSCYRNSSNSVFSLWASGAGSYSGIINMYSSRGSLSSPTISQNLDQFLQITSYGHDGTTYRETCTILAQASSAPAAGSIPTDLIFKLNAGSTSATELMRLKYTGRLGIGTSSPECKLHIYSGAGGGASVNAATVVKIENNGSEYIEFETGASDSAGLLFSDASGSRGAFRYNHSSDSITMDTAGATVVTINSSGELALAPIDPPTAGYANGNSFVRGWIDFSVTAATTISVNDSYNVSTQSVSGWTQVLVVWNRDFDSANYSVVFGHNRDANPSVNLTGSQTAAQAEVNSNGAASSWRGYVQAFGVQ